MEQKTCTKCNQDKDNKEFRFLKTRNLFTSVCWKCEKRSLIERTKIRRKQIGTSQYNNRKYGKTRSSALKRKIYFKLSKDEHTKIRKQDICFYCKKDYRKYPFIKSIDRVNNEIGYVVSNCVMCCLECNMLKGKLKKSTILSLRKIISVVSKI